MEAIKKRIDELLAQKDMVMVTIDGKCTSGKTTLASKLESLFLTGPLIVVHSHWQHQ